jgi:hypothetical protein
MLKTVLGGIVIVLVLIVAGVLIYAATKPDEFRVQRQAAIKARPEKIFPLINDFRRWDAWSPWEKKDPGMQRTYSGATEGKGAAYAWIGNKDVGQGRMEITESTSPSKIRINLDFTHPFEAHNVVEFALAPAGDQTTVTWSMRGPTPFMAKVVHVFLDMDKMVGTDFEAGLTAL